MDNLLYVGANWHMGAGLFRTDDEGDSWASVTTKEMVWSTVTSLDVFGSTLYAGTLGSGVFRSDDKGDSWIPISKGMTNQSVTTLVVVDNETLLAGTKKVGIFRTKDGGNSWMEVNTGISASVVDLEVLGDRIYALGVAGSRLLYSPNSGDSWESIEVPPKPNSFQYSGISALNGKLYVGASRFVPNNRDGGIFQLDERNNSLIEVKTHKEMFSIECMHIVGPAFYVGTQGKGVFLWNEGWDSWLNLGLKEQPIMEISVSETDVYARTWKGKVFRLKDHQKPWEPINDSMARGKFAQTTWIDNKLYALSAREGLLRSVDGGNSWTQLNVGIEHVSIETVEIDVTDFYIGTTQHGVFKWLHKDETWEQLGLLNRPVQSLVVLDGYLYAGTAAGVHRVQIEK